MTLEDFKDVYKDKTPVEKLKLMQEQHYVWRYDMKDRIDANWRGNFEEAQYYARECDAMRDRIIWLHEEISKALESIEPLAPVQDGNGALICGNQTLGCGVVGIYDVETGRVTEKISNYCAFCGRKMKWDD